MIHILLRDEIIHSIERFARKFDQKKKITVTHLFRRVYQTKLYYIVSRRQRGTPVSFCGIVYEFFGNFRKVTYHMDRLKRKSRAKLGVYFDY